MEKCEPIVLLWEDMTRDGKICSERDRLRKILEDVPSQQRELCERLIDRAAFMLVTLLEYEEIIIRDGIITEMPQGNYSIQRENPAAKGYNTMIKNYQAVIKQLTDLLPDKKDAAVEEAGERLKDFVRKGKK